MKDKNFEYTVPHLMEAMNRTKEDNWHNDEWASDVIDAAVKAGYILRPSVTQCEWTNKGIELLDAFRYRELNNGQTAVYIGESYFGNEMFKIYDALISNWTEFADKKGNVKVKEGVFLLVDDVLCATTQDLEPLGPVKKELLIKTEAKKQEEREQIEKDILAKEVLKEKSKNVSTLAPLTISRANEVTEAISEETKIGNLAHYASPIIIREAGILTEQQEKYLRESGDGNIYGGDTWVGQTIFGVEDSFEPIEEYIEKIKESDFYKFFVETVSNAAEKEYLPTDKVFHDFSDKYKTLSDVESGIEQWNNNQPIRSTVTEEEPVVSYDLSSAKQK